MTARRFCEAYVDKFGLAGETLTIRQSKSHAVYPQPHIGSSNQQPYPAEYHPPSCTRMDRNPKIEHTRDLGNFGCLSARDLQHVQPRTLD